MWSEGAIGIPVQDGKTVRFKYQVKHYQTGSEHGINGGRISKMLIRNCETGEIAAHYERGWDKEPEEGTPAEIAYCILLNNYN